MLNICKRLGLRTGLTTGLITGFAASVLLALPATPALGAEGGGGAPKKSGASKVEQIPGTNLMRITLTQKAAERLDIKTGKTAADANGVMTAPYAALFYDGKGKTWVYTNPEPLVYVRAPVVVESIKGPTLVLKEGPAAGTTVVVVGVAELYGAETGIGK